MNSSLNLMRRLPPSQTGNLSGLVGFVPGAGGRLQRLTNRCKLALMNPNNKKFIMCDYNRDGDSYRSWSNAYYPPIDDGFLPSDALRQTEVEANRVFDAYRHLYFEGGVSSVYLWDIDDGFAGCFLIKKEITEKKRSVSEGCWDSIHVVEVNETGNDTAVYKLTTTVMLAMEVLGNKMGSVDLSGGLTRQSEKTAKFDKVNTHLVHIGKMIEDQETNIRTNIDQLYVQKTMNIVGKVRSGYGRASEGPTKAFVADLSGRHTKKMQTIETLRISVTPRN